jgi:hypothetical protein
MSVIEVQYQQAIFFNLIRRNINLRPPPISELQGSLVDEWECTSVALATAAQTSGLDPLLPGTLRLAASITIYLTSYTAAKAAGSGVRPQLTPLSVTAIIHFSGGIGNQLAIEIESVQAFGANFSNLAQSLTFDPISFDAVEGINVARTWIGAGSDFIAIRLATNVGDGVNHPLTGRIPVGADWAQHVAAALIGEQAQAMLEEQIEEMSDVVIEEEPSWSWMPLWSGFTGWGLYLYVGIEAIDGCGGVDMSVDVYTQLTFASDFTQTPPQRRQQMYVSWDVVDSDSLLCGLQFAVIPLGIGSLFGPIGAVIGAVIGGVLIGIIGGVIEGETASKLGNQGEVDEMVKIGGGEDDGYLLYEGSEDLTAPDTAGLDATVQGFAAISDGLIVFGAAAVTQPSRKVSYYAGQPWWLSDYDCKKHEWYKQFHEPNLTISDPTRPLIVYEVKAVPDAQWNISQQPPGEISFLPDPNTPVPLTPLEAFVHCSAGVRWFQFSPIPPEPEPPSDMQVTFYEVECKVNSMKEKPKDWPFGFFNPKWHIDPPHDEVSMGRDLIREWLLAIEDLQAGSVIQVFAVREGMMNPTNFDSRFAQSKAVVYANSRGFAAVRIPTRTNQELMIQVDPTANHFPSLRISRRWLVPRDRIEFSEPIEAIAHVSSGIAVATVGNIRVLERSGRIGPPLGLRAVERHVTSGLSYRGLRSEKLGRLVAAATRTYGIDYSPGTMAIDETRGNVYVIDGNSLVVCGVA